MRRINQIPVLMSQHLICHEYKKIPHIDNKVQHIQEELMWGKGES